VSRDRRFLAFPAAGRPAVLAVYQGLAALLVLVAACSKSGLPSDPMAYPDEGPALSADELAVPADLEVVGAADTFVRLSWSDTTGSLPAIVIQGRLQGDQDFSLWHIVPAGVQEWDAPVQPDSSYAFRIAARNGEGHSPYTEEVAATALPMHYLEVSGGVHRDGPCCTSVFFRFGRANFFSPPGTLTISGPAGWNDDRVFQSSWGSRYIGLNGRGAATGFYELEFQAGGRRFEARAFIDASLVLPLPSVDIEDLGVGRMAVSWDCPDADSFSFTFGPAQSGAVIGGTSSRDTVVVFEETAVEHILEVGAHRADLQGQPASSSWSTRLTYPLAAVTPAGR
jgi:hypothetical protein